MTIWNKYFENCVQDFNNDPLSCNEFRFSLDVYLAKIHLSLADFPDLVRQEEDLTRNDYQTGVLCHVVKIVRDIIKLVR